ncbi:MAG: hypothetical protein Q9184_008232, partial [Pyrenodesmia sp. 2 TL-2023]
IKTKESGLLELEMRVMASEIRAGISKYDIVHHPQLGQIFAYGVNGYGSKNLMDDANLPSLLSAAMTGYVSSHNEDYQNTQLFVLSEHNPYWMHGEILDAVCGPHIVPTNGWPLASFVIVMTSDDSSGEETKEEIKAIMSFTNGLGLIHESVNPWDVKDWSRQRQVERFYQTR